MIYIVTKYITKFVGKDVDYEFEGGILTFKLRLQSNCNIG